MPQFRRSGAAFVMFFQRIHHAGQEIRSQYYVRVECKVVFPLRGSDRLVVSVAETFVFWILNDRNIGEMGLEDGDGVVLGGIINEDGFEVRIVLLLETFQAFWKARGAVPGDQSDG